MNISLRPLILSVLMTLFILPVSGQETAGSNIVSRTLLQSDGSKAIQQRVYDNGLGDNSIKRPVPSMLQTK